jgi:hypothetical protein
MAAIAIESKAGPPMRFGTFEHEVIGEVDDVVAEAFDQLRGVVQSGDVADADAELDSDSHAVRLARGSGHR